MAIWPVFLDRAMHEDHGALVSVGDTVSWDVVLVDGMAAGWPMDRLVQTDVRIEPRPDFALRGQLATASELAACWRGPEPIGSEIRVLAGLSVDLFNPPFRSTATGRVISIETVRSRMAKDSLGVWSPVGPWQLTEVSVTPRWLVSRKADPGTDQDLGFLIGLELHSCRIQDFSPH